MELKQLVEINEKANIANAVNFGMMDDPELNLALCESFIFNDDRANPKTSTVGILDAVRRSYHSPSTPNIHLVVQQYGKGKSHFALAVANFFSQPTESSEVQGVLNQIEIATSGSKIAEELRTFKQNRRYLTICLSGDFGGDLRQHFLNQFIKILDREAISDSIARQICGEPLQYLEGLDAQKQQKADRYLKQLDYPNGDLPTLIDLLRQNKTDIIPHVKELTRHLTDVTPDFQSDIDIETIIEEVIQKVCSGEQPRFQGILILFDELNFYLKSWSEDSIKAGGLSIQNITNICEKYKSKVALLSFAQVSLKKTADRNQAAEDSYLKVASRLEPTDSTYYPESSLELVLNNLLSQKENTEIWNKFFARWNATLLGETRSAYEKRIEIYRQQNWSFEKFFKYLGLGCFPLHPITAYLLSKLDFAQIQDRNAIQFVKGDVKKFIESNSIETNGFLNYIRPIALLDTFLETLSKFTYYEQFISARDRVINSENANELKVVKALFLYFVSQSKLINADNEPHEQILSELSGVPVDLVRKALQELQDRDLIYFQSKDKLYSFHSGAINPGEIRRQIEEEAKREKISLQDAIVHLQSKLEDPYISAKDFVTENKLVEKDWRFEYEITSVADLRRSIKGEQIVKGSQSKGLVVYALGQSDEELRDFRETIDRDLQNSPIADRLVVAIPNHNSQRLSRLLLLRRLLSKRPERDKDLYGSAFAQVVKEWDAEIDEETKRLRTECTYHCKIGDRLLPGDRSNVQKVISILLSDVYPLVAPVNNIDKLRSGQGTGRKIANFIARQLFGNSFNIASLPPETYYKTVINSVFIKSWGLFILKREKYEILTPKNYQVSEAWKFISEQTDLNGQSEKTIELARLWKTLSAPPYGYNEITFTVLLCAWLAFHRKEVFLKGVNQIPKRKSERCTVVTQPLREWVSSNIFEKGSDFVDSWIIQQKAKLIRRKTIEVPEIPSSPMSEEKARSYLEDVKAFLSSPDIEADDKKRVEKDRDRIKPKLQEFETWFEPTRKAEEVLKNAKLDELIPLYPQLKEDPPAIDLSHPDRLYVIPSESARSDRDSALKQVQEQLEEQILALTERVDELDSEEGCENYKAELKQVRDRLKSVPELANRFVENLDYALQQLDRVKQQIRDCQDIQEALDRIDREFNTLQENASQGDYTQVSTAIEALVKEAPEFQEIADKIKGIKEAIDRQSQELLEKIETWETRSTNVMSKQAIYNLTQEIAGVRSRFTEPESIHRLESLETRLKEELLAATDRDESEANLRDELVQIKQQIRSQNASIQTCESQCDRLEKLREQWHDSEVLKSEIEAVVTEARQAIAKFIDNLNRISSELDTLTNSQELNKLEINYSKQEFIFKNSSYFDRYSQIEYRIEALREDLNSVEELRDFVEKSNSTEDCQDCLNRVQILRNELGDPMRFQSLLDDWEERLNRTLKQHHDRAHEWFETLQQDFQRLYQCFDDRQKLKIAQNLCDRIETEREKYQYYFNRDTEQSLTRIERECYEIQNQNKVHQIIVLFQQLPRVQRQAVYKQLESYLSDTDDNRHE